VSQASGDVGVLLTILRSESDFDGDCDGADYFKAPGDISELVLRIAATGAGFRCRRITGRLARGAWGSLDSEAIAETPSRFVDVAALTCAGGARLLSVALHLVGRRQLRFSQLSIRN